MAKNWSRNSSCFWYNRQHETFLLKLKKPVLHEYLSRPPNECMPHTIKVRGKKFFWLEFNSIFSSVAHIFPILDPAWPTEQLDWVDLRPPDLSFSYPLWRTNLFWGQKALPLWWFPIQLILQHICTHAGNSFYWNER